MNSYICINGHKTELTAEQMKELGFAFPRTIEDYTIGEISEIVKKGEARNVFKIHDVITVCDFSFEIIGFDHDKDAENPSLPTMTLRLKSPVYDRRMHDGSCERGWIDTELRAWLNFTFVKELPAELIPFIRPVLKTTHNYKGEVFDTVDKLFLFSESELFGSAIYSPAEDGERYEAFATSGDRRVFDSDGDSTWYWERSPRAGTGAIFCAVSSSGAANDLVASYSIGVAVGFCF